MTRGRVVIIVVALAGLVAIVAWWATRPTEPSATSAGADAATPGRTEGGPESRRTAPDRPGDAVADPGGNDGGVGQSPDRDRARAEIDRRTGIAAADALVERLAAIVTLEPETREALTQVLREEREAAAEIMEANPPGSEERRLALDQLRNDTLAGITALLSEEQLAAYHTVRPAPPTQEAPPPTR